MQNPFRYFNNSTAIIRLAVMMYVRFPLSLRQVEDLLSERGIDICHDTVRFLWNRFGPLFAAEIRKRRIHLNSHSNWCWHLDEVFARIKGETHYLWRAVDHEGEGFRDETPGSQGCTDVFEAHDEALRSAGFDRHGQASVIPRSDECDRQCGRPDLRSLPQQPGGKFTPAVQTTGRGNGEIPGRQDHAEIRRVHASIHNHFKERDSPEVIRFVVMMYIRYPLSLRQVEDILHERGIDICHETVRYWWNPLVSKGVRLAGGNSQMAL